ncbi:hypothetical protein ACFLZ8_01700 [Planctomycetota bacterium]
MDNIHEKRLEKRLCYRWPIKFAKDSNEINIHGQAVDINSRGLSFLCHADNNCPISGQLISLSFGVPYFNDSNSFDTVLFNRQGYIFRVNKLNKHICQVIVSFSEPLFFRPGEQEISESEATQRLENKALSVLKAEEKAQAYSKALTIAEEKSRSLAKAKAMTEEKLRAEIEERCQTDVNLRLEAEEKLTAYAEETARAKERLKTEIQLRSKAEAKANKEVAARKKAEKKLQLYIEEISKIKSVSKDTITKLKTEIRDMAPVDKKKQNKYPIKDVIIKKVDNFITDKNKIL